MPVDDTVEINQCGGDDPNTTRYKSNNQNKNEKSRFPRGAQRWQQLDVLTRNK